MLTGVDLPGRIDVRCRPFRVFPAAATLFVRSAKRARLRPAFRVFLGVCSAQPLANLWQNQHDRRMNYSLRSLTAATVVALALLEPWTVASGQWSVAGSRETGGGGAVQRASGFTQEVSKAPTVGYASGINPEARERAARPGFTIIRGQEPGVTGQQLVAQAAKRLADEKQIAAELRYKIDAYGHELLGTGKYVQAGAADDRLLRLELRMQVGERPATLLEIRGGELYWMRRDIPPAEATLERLNLMQLRKALTSTPDQASDVLPQGGWIILGGLPRLLANIEQSFFFAAPKADEVQYQAADGKSIEKLPIWIVQGEWKPERLAALTNRAPGKLTTLPDQLPDRIELVLSRTSEQLALFPFRIVYRRTAAADSKSPTPPPARELLTLEFFNVSTTKALDPREFLYEPSDNDVDARDITTAYIQRLSGEANEKKLR
jgi:hypothetical protein